MNIEHEIQKRIDGLNLEDSNKDRAIVMMTGNLYRRVGARIATEVPGEDLDKFNSLVDSSPREAFDFLNSKLPEFDSLVMQELDLLAEEFKILDI